MKKQREAANFRAKPAAILEREPFRPKPSEKLPTALDEEFQLNSDRRAAERILFDEYKEAIQNYIMTGHEKGWMQCDILSDGISFEPGRQMHETTPYISMDMGKVSPG